MPKTYLDADLIFRVLRDYKLIGMADAELVTLVTPDGCPSEEEGGNALRHLAGEIAAALESGKSDETAAEHAISADVAQLDQLTKTTGLDELVVRNIVHFARQRWKDEFSYSEDDVVLRWRDGEFGSAPPAQDLQLTPEEIHLLSRVVAKLSGGSPSVDAVQVDAVRMWGGRWGVRINGRVIVQWPDKDLADMAVRNIGTALAVTDAPSNPTADVDLQEDLRKKDERIKQLEDLYEGWKPISEAPHPIHIERGSMLEFYSVRDDGTYWTGDWDDRRDANIWCLIQTPMLNARAFDVLDPVVSGDTKNGSETE